MKAPRQIVPMPVIQRARPDGGVEVQEQPGVGGGNRDEIGDRDRGD